MTDLDRIRAMEKDGALIDTCVEDGVHRITVVDRHWRMFTVESTERYDWKATYEMYQARMNRPGGLRLRRSTKAKAA